MSNEKLLQSRRNALKCMAYGAAGTAFVLVGGVFTPVDLAMAAETGKGGTTSVKPLFVQISDTHIGFNKEANPDVAGTFAVAQNHLHEAHVIAGGGIQSSTSIDMRCG